MNSNKYQINSDTTISEAIQILKQKAEDIAREKDAEQFYENDTSWSNLFRKSYQPYEDALAQYEDALELNKWLNGENPENGHLTLLDAFLKMTDQQRLTLFQKRINSKVPGLFDEYLRTWWINRY